MVAAAATLPLSNNSAQIPNVKQPRVVAKLASASNRRASAGGRALVPAAPGGRPDDGPARLSPAGCQGRIGALYEPVAGDALPTAEVVAIPRGKADAFLDCAARSPRTRARGFAHAHR